MSGRYRGVTAWLLQLAEGVSLRAEIKLLRAKRDQLELQVEAATEALHAVTAELRERSERVRERD